MKKKENNISYLGNEGYRKAFSLGKKTPGKRKRKSVKGENNMDYIGNEDKEKRGGGEKRKLSDTKGIGIQHRFFVSGD